MRFVILTVLVACAMGMEFDLKNLQGMLGGLGGMGNIGNLMGQAKNMMEGLNLDDISSMIKDIDPEELKGIIDHMPPQMMEMVEGMGISKEEISEAAAHLPEHVDEVKGMIGEAQNGNIQKLVKSELQNMGLQIPEEDDMGNIMSTLKTQAKEKMSEFGLDVEDFQDIKSAMPKLMSVLQKQLKEQGVEIETANPEGMKKQLEKMLMVHFEIPEDASPEEMRARVMGKMREYIADLGIEYTEEDMETPEKAMNMLKKKFLNTANGYGFEFKDDASFDEIKEAVMSKVKNSGILENPMQYLPMLIKGFNSIGGMKMLMGETEQPQPQMQMSPEQMMMMQQQRQLMIQRQMMMQRRPMPMNMNFEINVDGQNSYRPPNAFPAYLRGAEDALMHAYGDDEEVVRHVMTVQQGISQGAVSEEAVHELLSDLMHARLQTRVLAARNQMLEQQVMHEQFETRIPVSKSPFLNHIRHKYRHGRKVDLE
ncbi:uncharacterized protein LOC110457679 [Mizuhopecten yessoensis]|uniref:uncharacterized protein LOC110457679 n=1 Tax=Mizuhopecten yessoensis TaxID=6573 RepID=UPI000B45E594|nr:uncharacterized protein LOC110457679 [Mizuhopecten yessoensis]